MAFFDDLKKTISGTSQTVVNKTKDLTGITKLSAKVSDLQKKNDQLYRTIGRIYMENYGDDPGDAFKGAAASIKENLAQIEACQKEIKDLKGITVCSCCGADIASGTQFCPKCGTKVELDEIVADAEIIEDAPEEAAQEPAAEEETAEEAAPEETAQEPAAEEETEG